MPEFGNHPGGSGATFDNAFNNVVWAKATTTPGDGTLTTISIRIRSKAGSPTVNCAIYSDLAGAPNVKLAEGSAVSVAAENWYTVTVGAALTSGVQYWFAWIVPGGGGGTDAEAAEDTNGGLTEVFFQALGAFPATMSGASSQTNERYWMYGTYTPAVVPGVDGGFKSRIAVRPSPFKPMGDGFHPALYKDWR